MQSYHYRVLGLKRAVVEKPKAVVQLNLSDKLSVALYRRSHSEWMTPGRVQAC
jgi:hypothetical protein